MTIIHIVLGKANPERMNGVNKVVHTLATVQAEQGMNVEIWGITHDTTAPVIERTLKTRLFKQRKFGLLDDFLVTMLRTEASRQTCVFHLHGAFIWEWWSVTYELVHYGGRYIFTPHGSYAAAAMQKSYWRKYIFFNLFEQYVLNNAYRVHLLGEGEAQGLASWYQLSASQLLIVPNGLDFGAFKYNNRPKNNENQLCFVFCGRLDTYHKGLDRLLEGFWRYIKMGGTGRLDLIGDGDDRVALQNQANDYGIQAQVQFLGAKFGDEKWNALMKATAFLHPSRMEGFPMAVVEAAALGIPCITSDATNVNGFLRQYQAGIALEDIEGQTIALALCQIERRWHADNLTEWSDNAKKMARTEFDIQKIAHTLIQNYQ